LARPVVRADVGAPLGEWIEWHPGIRNPVWTDIEAGIGSRLSPLDRRALIKCVNRFLLARQMELSLGSVTHMRAHLRRLRRALGEAIRVVDPRGRSPADAGLVVEIRATIEGRVRARLGLRADPRYSLIVLLAGAAQELLAEVEAGSAERVRAAPAWDSWALDLSEFLTAREQRVVGFASPKTARLLLALHSCLEPEIHEEHPDLLAHSFKALEDPIGSVTKALKRARARLIDALQAAELRARSLGVPDD
jgi:hypothetical protein